MVIAIIGLLASIVIVSLSTSRERGRNAKRKSEINGISKALELYYLDNSSYPIAASWISIEEDAGFSSAMTEYLSNIPSDPLYGSVNESGDSYSYQYISSDDGTCYMMMAFQEDEEGDLIKYSSTECEASLGGASTGGSDSANSIAEALDNPVVLLAANLTLGGTGTWTVNDVDYFPIPSGDSSAMACAPGNGGSAYLEFDITTEQAVRFRVNNMGVNPDDEIKITWGFWGEGEHTFSGDYSWAQISAGTFEPGHTARVEYINNSTSDEETCIFFEHMYFLP